MEADLGLEVATGRRRVASQEEPPADVPLDRGGRAADVGEMPVEDRALVAIDPDLVEAQPLLPDVRMTGDDP